MNTPHLSEENLARFVAGDLDEQVGASFAEHIDGCSMCATRAAALEPLNGAFAAAVAREPPPDLVERVLTAIETPDWTPLREIVAGASLILAAGALAVLVEGPAALAGDVAAGTTAVLALARSVGVVLASFQIVAAVTTVLALAGVVLTLQFSTLSPGARRARAAPSGEPPAEDPS